MQHIGHELLETRVLYARDALGAREIGRRLVAARLALAGVVDQKLGHFAECPPFLAVVDDESGAATLRAADALLDAMREIRSTGADVRAEDVRAVAFVVNPTGQRARRIVHRRRVTKNIERHAADGRQKHMQVVDASRVPDTCRRSARKGCAAAALSVTPKRSATPGRYQTGSMAAFVTLTSPPGCTITPSSSMRPSRMASRISCSVSLARVTAMVGRMSSPPSISARKSSAAR